MSRQPESIAGHSVDRSTIPLLITLAIGVFAGALDLGVLAPALPALGNAFGVSTADLSWIYTLYLFVNIISITVASKLADQYGRRPVYIGCIGAFALGSVLAIGAPNFLIFLLARAIAAFGAGGIFPVATAAIGDSVTIQRRGSALGMIGATWGLAAIIGPNFGGLVTHFFSWHWIFAMNVPLAIVVIALARRYVPVNAPQVRGSLDVAGLSILCIGIGSLMFGVATGRYYLLLMTLAMAPAFYASQRRAAAPIFSPVLFRNTQLMRTYGLETVIGLLEGALFFIPAALIVALHLSAASAGALAGLGAVVFVAVIPLSGRALDSFGSRTVLAVGATFTTVGLAIFAFGLGTLWLALLGILVAGIGFGALLGAPTRYIVTNEAPEDMRATGIGLLSQCLIVGQIAGGSLAGGIVRSGANVVSGFRSAYEIFALFGILTMLMTAALRSSAHERASATSRFAG